MLNVASLFKIWHYSSKSSSHHKMKQKIESLFQSIFMYVMQNYSAELYEKYASLFKCILPFVIENEMLLSKNDLDIFNQVNL